MPIGRIAVEPEPPFAHAFGEHEEEGREAEVRALLIDEGGVEHFGALLARPGDAHAVEQRVQDAEADIHAVDGHAGLHQPLHGDLDQRGERRVGEARGDDRGRDVGDVRQAVRVELSMVRPLIGALRGEFMAGSYRYRFRALSRFRWHGGLRVLAAMARALGLAPRGSCPVRPHRQSAMRARRPRALSRPVLCGTGSPCRHDAGHAAPR